MISVVHAVLNVLLATLEYTLYIQPQSQGGPGDNAPDVSECSFVSVTISERVLFASRSLFLQFISLRDQNFMD